MTYSMLANSKKSALPWLALNLVLLGCYLGFFHMALAITFPSSLAIGVVISVVATCLIVRLRKLFVNRFEFVLYLVVPLDIVLESLIPFHSGYSFYFCAASFWLVFGTYRIGRWIRSRPPPYTA